MTDYCLHYAPDNASLVIRLALNEMGLPYRTALVDRRAGAQHSAAYRALNPAGLIPVLETPDGPIFETAAILLWLADRHPAAGLFPTPDSPQRATALKWLFHLSNTVHADLRILFYPDKYIPTEAVPAAHIPNAPEEAAITACAALQDGIKTRLMQHLERFDQAAAAEPSLLWHGNSDANPDPNPDTKTNTADGSAGQPTLLTLYVACMMRWMALYPTDRDRSWLDLGATPCLATALSRLERRDSAISAADAEGLGPAPFTQPCYANPSEGSAT
ncbi:glutathione S-transferase N-terminal domain-containing protein [Phaeobacter sp.]|uniref:glutathione S-transferase family protein n=1 Tax=Phaeobacter sp. TaxID=1902409 RepID=UPI0025D8D0C8|nr:glutathione S-transferase N-terminal domain-containing protein [Phaeobacter sp.]